jgi:hypothetical protein
VRALLDLALGLAAAPSSSPTAQPQQEEGGAPTAPFDCPGKRAPFLILEDVFDVLGVAQVEVSLFVCLFVCLFVLGFGGWVRVEKEGWGCRWGDGGGMVA